MPRHISWPNRVPSLDDSDRDPLTGEVRLELAHVLRGPCPLLRYGSFEHPACRPET